MNVETITIITKDEEESDIVKHFLQDLNIHFEIGKTNLVSGMEWFEKTESLNSILNSLVAHYSVEGTNLLKKPQTKEYIKNCGIRKAEIKKLLRNNDVWDSLELMEQNIEKYSPILKQINSAANYERRN